jgi:hypothetical protein
MRVNDVILNTCLPIKGLVICIDICLVMLLMCSGIQVRVLSAVYSQTTPPPLKFDICTLPLQTIICAAAAAICNNYCCLSFATASFMVLLLLRCVY